MSTNKACIPARRSANRIRSRAGTTRGRSGAAPIPELFHFTCSHFELPIRAVGAVIPHRHPWFPSLGAVAWFTTDQWADPDRTGLTSSTLSCDRTRFRFRVTEAEQCLPWCEVRDYMVGVQQAGFTAQQLKNFERFGAPETWWISPTPVPVVPA